MKALASDLALLAQAAAAYAALALMVLTLGAQR